MLYRPDATDSHAPRSQDSMAPDAAPRSGWAPLAVPPLTLLVVGVAFSAQSPGDVAVAALSLLALLLAAAAFAAAA